MSVFGTMLGWVSRGNSPAALDGKEEETPVVKSSAEQVVKALAYLFFRNPNTKLTRDPSTGDYSNDRSYFRDYNITEAPIDQGIKRYFLSSLGYESSSEGLMSLEVPVYRALKRYRPHEQKESKQIFEYALQGVERLQKTAYSEKEMVADHLFRVHSLLEKGLAGRELEPPRNLDLWEEDPHIRASSEFWQENVESWQGLCRAFEAAQKYQAENLYREKEDALQAVNKIMEEMRLGIQTHLANKDRKAKQKEKE